MELALIVIIIQMFLAQIKKAILKINLELV